MPILICLNELSCTTSNRRQDVDAAMAELVDVVREINKRRPGAALVTPERLPAIELCPGYPMAKWAADTRNLDQWRFLRRRQDRSPVTFADIVPPEIASRVDYRHLGRPAAGLAAADISDGIAVSLPVDDAWTESGVEVTRIAIDEQESRLTEDAVQVRHASHCDHVSTHRDWLSTAGVTTILTGDDLWRLRAEHFPDVEFLPRVEDDLAKLDRCWVHPVRTVLAKVQQSVSDWNPEIRPQPAWQTFISPEAEQRKRLCSFTDVDGTSQVFDQHARFTPGAGRLHFRLVAENRTARVGYIGKKL
ncbi:MULTISPECIES: hypothetical protein [Actinoalloteichus]|uniref:Uncharacterized protein n=1 Tax=Actinoalloteichus fjordicus TaxID=1612552 RepID=A0AAC9LG53_9PSEU|nr:MULTISPECIES: hypothetical protein [Actinoalloteichus]APU17218.1 hypothetical protein UA74_26065 [Actinoalloteichus fjordicus]APU23301.1 hypothetical protein UA75_26650 [Actinoalloteichus sp. GBA129-24]